MSQGHTQITQRAAQLEVGYLMVSATRVTMLPSMLRRKCPAPTTRGGWVMQRAKLRGPHPFGHVGCQGPAPLILTEWLADIDHGG